LSTRRIDGGGRVEAIREVGVWALTWFQKRETLMVNSVRSEENGDRRRLPGPNVVVTRSGTPIHNLPPEAIKGILVNPIYTGVGPFPRMVEDVEWVRACAKLIEEEGPEQFLVNLLFVLRECLPADPHPE
jgi:hypothetical protein